MHLAELLREKLFRLLGDELPHRIGVTAEIAEERPKWLKAALTVHVEKESQKRIVIGAAGGLLKAAISATRLEVERRRGGKVFLSVHVRVTAWRQNPALLNQMRIGRMATAIDAGGRLLRWQHLRTPISFIGETKPAASICSMSRAARVVADAQFALDEGNGGARVSMTTSTAWS